MYTIPQASKLARAGKAGYEKLSSDRERRKKAVKIMVGPHYGKGEAKGKRYINLLRLGVRILATNLVPRNPKVDAMPKLTGLRPIASALAEECEQWIEQYKFKHLMRRAVRESLLAPFSIVYTCLKDSGKIANLDGQACPIGESSLTLVDFDDYSCDPAARNREEMSFEAFKFRVKKDDFLRLPDLDGDARKRFEELPALGESESEDRTSDLAGEEAEQYDLYDIVELWRYVLYCGDNVYEAIIPDAEGHDGEYLMVTPYVGAERGPIELLSFEDVPGCPMPLTPESGMRDLADAIDKVAGKMVRSLLHAKNVHIYNDEGADDAIEIQNAKDNDHVRVRDVANHKTLLISGVQEQAYSGLTYFINQFNQSSGNLLTLAGASQGENTATEAVQNQNNAGQYVGDMADAVLDFESALLRRVAAHKLNDPLAIFRKVEMLGEMAHVREITVDRDEVRSVLGETAPTEQPELQDGQESPVEDDLDIRPFGIRVAAASMLPMDPAMRLKRMNEFLMSVAPLTTIPGVDVRALMKIGEENLDIPELSEVFPEQPPMSMMPGMPGGPVDPAMAGPGGPMSPAGPPAPGRKPKGNGSFQNEVAGAAQSRAPR